MAEGKRFALQTLGEEIANSVSHGLGALMAIAGAVIVIVSACINSDAMGVVGASIYGASLIILYTFSTLYHSITNPTAKGVFRIFDHCSIFILILGTYTPICFTILKGKIGWTLFSINTLCTVIGVVFNSIDMKRWQKLSMALYIIMGWLIIISFKSLVSAVPLKGLVLLVAGGIAYTLGIIFFTLKQKYMHFIWHIFVLAGSILQYFFVLLYCF